MTDEGAGVFLSRECTPRWARPRRRPTAGRGRHACVSAAHTPHSGTSSRHANPPKVCAPPSADLAGAGGGVPTRGEAAPPGSTAGPGGNDATRSQGGAGCAVAGGADGRERAHQVVRLAVMALALLGLLGFRRRAVASTRR